VPDADEPIGEDCFESILADLLAIDAARSGGGFGPYEAP